MPLPTSVPETAESAYLRATEQARSTQSNLQLMADLLGPSPASPLTMENLIGLYQHLFAARATGMSIQAVEGLSDYAKTVKGPDYDINAEFLTSVVACKAVTDCILTVMPGDGHGRYLGYQVQADGSMSRVVQVDPSTLAPLASLIAAALATFA